MISIAISSILIFLFTLAENNDTRLPPAKLGYRYRVKDNSILRKIIKFKDKKYYPCNYFKIIPVYVYLIISIISLILLIVDILFDKILSENINTTWFICINILLYGIYLLYLISLYIWWGIADYKETKFTKEQKNELKKLRKYNKNKSKEKKK